MRQADAKLQRVLGSKLEKISWDDLKILALASRFSSFRKAAKLAGRNASTVARQVDRLEEALGTTLFNRQPEGFVLTDEGVRIARIAADMERLLVGIDENSGHDSKARGVVKVAITEGLGAFWLSPHLAGFTRDNPEILVDLYCSMENVDLLRHDADIAIQFSRPVPQDIVAMRLCYMHIYPFASIKYIDQHGIPRSKADISKHKIVDQTSSNLQKGVIERHLEINDIVGITTMKTNSSVALLYAVEMGLGIGGLPTFAMVLGADLIPIDIGISHRLEIWISYKSESKRLKRVSMTIDWLREVFNPKKYPWFQDSFVHPSDLANLYYGKESIDFFSNPSLMKSMLEDGKFYPTLTNKKVGRPKKNT